MIAQEHIVAKSQELHQVVDEIVAVVTDAVRDSTPIHEVEGKTMTVAVHVVTERDHMATDMIQEVKR